MQVRKLGALLLGLVLATRAAADPAGNQGGIVRDGSIGAAPAGVVAPGVDPLSGPAEYLIHEGLGERAGANLFHSFERFGIGPGETATFTGSAGIANVISRVTGGVPSEIHGMLRSTVPDADVYLLNPAGVMFGDGAWIDVPGSFHVSTAHALRMADGTVLPTTDAEPPVLSAAAPAAFGFLGAPAPITSETQISGGFEPDDDLSVVGGDFHMQGGNLVARGGRIELVSVASAGEVRVNPGFGGPQVDVSHFEALGNVTLEGSRISSGKSRGSDISVRANEISLRDSRVYTENTEVLDGGRLDLRARGAIVLDDSGVVARTFNEARAGEVYVEARELRQSGLQQIGVFAPDWGLLPSGELVIRVRDLLQLEPNSTIATTGADIRIEALEGEVRLGGHVAPVRGGDLRIDARRVVVSDGARVGSEAWEEGTRRGGDVIVNASESVLVTGSTGSANGHSRIWTISNPGFDTPDDVQPAEAGDVHVNTPYLRLEGSGAIASESREALSARGGDIHVRADRIEIDSEGQIYSLTRGLRPAGDIDVVAREGISIRGTDVEGKVFDDRVTGIQSRSDNVSGAVGSVRVETPDLVLREGGAIGTLSLVEAPGGDLVVEADRVDVSGGSILDTSVALFGTGGDLTVRASESVTVRGANRAGSPSRIGSLSFTHGDAGDVRIETPFLLVDGGVVSTAALALGTLDVLVNGVIVVPISLVLEQLPKAPRFGRYLRYQELRDASGRYPDGAGGDLTVVADDVVLRGGAQLDTTNWGSGRSGRLVVQADRIDASGAGTLVASRAAGGGRSAGIRIEAGEVALQDGASVSLEAGPAAFDGGSVLAALDVPVNGALRSLEESTGFGVALLAVTPELLEALFANRPVATGAEGGDLVLRAGTLRLDDARISAGAIASAGGNLDLAVAGDVSLTGGARIDASVREGAGGNVRLEAGGDVALSESSAIRATASQGSGGNVTIRTPGLLRLRGATVSTSVASGEGGDVRLEPSVLLLQDGSRVTAQAETGRGGRISIVGDLVLVSQDSVVSASAGVGVSGTVEIQAPETVLSPEHAALSSEYLDPGSLLAARCAERRGGPAGSFRVRVAEGGSGPEGLIALAAPAEGEAPAQVAGRTALADCGP